MFVRHPLGLEVLDLLYFVVGRVGFEVAELTLENGRSLLVVELRREQRLRLVVGANDREIMVLELGVSSSAVNLVVVEYQNTHDSSPYPWAPRCRWRTIHQVVIEQLCEI